MEVIKHRHQPQSIYGAERGRNIHNLHVRTLYNNEMWIARSGARTSTPCSYDQPSPWRECNRCVQIVSKKSSPPKLSWWNDNEMKRKRRVAKYKLYAAQGRLKSSLSKGFRSFKITCKKIATSL